MVHASMIGSAFLNNWNAVMVRGITKTSVTPYVI